MWFHTNEDNCILLHINVYKCKKGYTHVYKCLQVNGKGQGQYILMITLIIAIVLV